MSREAVGRMRTTLEVASEPTEDFLALAGELDAELWRKEGDGHAVYHGHNRPVGFGPVVVAYDPQPVACGALKDLGGGTAEVKRMFVRPNARGRGLSRAVLAELERLAVSAGFGRLVLETNRDSREAVGLYSSSGYRVIDNYGPYVGLPASVCFEKEIRTKENPL